jgi:putative membrane protein
MTSNTAAEAEIRKTSKGVKASADSVKDTARHVKASAEEVRDSAAHIEDSAASIEDTSDRSTELAADRTVFAAERTYAAWVRTGLAALASGVGARALLSKIIIDPLVMFTSTVLVLFSAFCFCAAVWRELVPSLNDPLPRASRIPRPVLFFINGSLALVALAALAGIWISRSRAGM